MSEYPALVEELARRVTMLESVVNTYGEGRVTMAQNITQMAMILHDARDSFAELGGRFEALSTDVENLEDSARSHHDALNGAIKALNSIHTFIRVVLSRDDELAQLYTAELGKDCKGCGLRHAPLPNDYPTDGTQFEQTLRDLGIKVDVVDNGQRITLADLFGGGRNSERTVWTAGFNTSPVDDTQGAEPAGSPAETAGEALADETDERVATSDDVHNALNEQN